MERPRFSSTALNAQARARRVANEQLLRVPWGQFRKAYHAYPRWHGLWLWVEAINRMSGAHESLLARDLKKHAPDFVSNRVRSRISEPLAVSLWDWVHINRFGQAKQQGWLDALVFYGVRHSYSRGTWLYWEHCEREWDRHEPEAPPSFEEWWRSALNWHPCDQISCMALAAAVERYLEWESFKLWLHPLFLTASELDQDIRRNLDRYCPEIPHIDVGHQRGAAARRHLWTEVEQAANRHLLLPARQGHRVGDLIEQVRSHPWHRRIHAYASRRLHESTQSDVYPSFAQWKHAAAVYTKSKSGIDARPRSRGE